MISTRENSERATPPSKMEKVVTSQMHSSRECQAVSSGINNMETGRSTTISTSSMRLEVAPLWLASTLEPKCMACTQPWCLVSLATRLLEIAAGIDPSPPTGNKTRVVKAGDKRTWVITSRWVSHMPALGHQEGQIPKWWWCHQWCTLQCMLSAPGLSCQVSIRWPRANLTSVSPSKQWAMQVAWLPPHPTPKVCLRRLSVRTRLKLTFWSGKLERRTSFLKILSPQRLLVLAAAVAPIN